MKKKLTTLAFALLALSAPAQEFPQEIRQKDMEEFKALQKNFSEAMRRYNEESLRLKDEMPDTLKNRLLSERETAWQKVAKCAHDLAVKHRGTEDGAVFLRNFVNLRQVDFDLDEALRILSFYKNLEETEIIKEVTEILEGLQNRRIGADAVSLVLLSPDGNELNLKDIVGKGNYVFVDFWASWCGGCIEIMPTLKEIYTEFHSSGFEILGISIDREEERWAKAMEKLDLPWVQAIGMKDRSAEKVFGINALPFSILYSPEGKVVATNLSVNELKETLQEIYSKK